MSLAAAPRDIVQSVIPRWLFEGVQAQAEAAKRQQKQSPPGAWKALCGSFLSSHRQTYGSGTRSIWWTILAFWGIWSRTHKSQTGNEGAVKQRKVLS